MVYRLFLFLLTCALLPADDGQRLLRVDHYVRVRSIAPSMNGQTSQVYVREVVQAGAALRGGAAGENRVILFIHGAGTPAEVAFDVPYRATTVGWRIWRRQAMTCSRWT